MVYPMKKIFALILMLSLLLSLAAAGCAESHTHTGGTATCQSLAVCSKCGQSYGHLADHSWGSWVSDGDSTHTRTCQTNPGHKETRYHMGGASNCTQGAQCLTCGAVHEPALGHIPVFTAGYAATCENGGLTDAQICARCGHATVPHKRIPATGHSFNTWDPLPGGLHTSTCATASCGNALALMCQPFEVTVGDALITVCPICGSCGETPFPLLLARAEEALPMGQLLVRGMAEPFEGALYAFTVTGSYAGNPVALSGSITVALPEDLSALPAFRLERVDVTPAEGDTPRTEARTEIEYKLEAGKLTFVTDTTGLFLLVAAD